jgi:hypothetical protein
MLAARKSRVDSIISVSEVSAPPELCMVDVNVSARAFTFQMDQIITYITLR